MLFLAVELVLRIPRHIRAHELPRSLDRRQAPSRNAHRPCEMHVTRQDRNHQIQPFDTAKELIEVCVHRIVMGDIPPEAVTSLFDLIARVLRVLKAYEFNAWGRQNGR